MNLVQLLNRPEIQSKLDVVNWRTQDTSRAEQAEGALLTAEELSELVQAVIKYYVRRKNHAVHKVIEESVDVILMMDQMVRMLPEDELLSWVDMKLDRTIARYHTVGSTYDDTQS